MALLLYGFERPSQLCYSGGRRTLPWDHLCNDTGDVHVFPRRHFDQHFGLIPLVNALLQPKMCNRTTVHQPKRQVEKQTTSDVKQTTSDVSQVSNIDKEFHVNMNVSEFKPEELTIKVIDNRIVIEGKHEEKEDGQGYIQRQFKRIVILPDNVDPDTVKSSLGANDILSIHAQKKVMEINNEKVIPIESMEDVEQPVPTENTSENV